MRNIEPVFENSHNVELTLNQILKNGNPSLAEKCIKMNIWIIAGIESADTDVPIPAPTTWTLGYTAASNVHLQLKFSDGLASAANAQA